MCWSELSAVIAWLTSKCLWSGWKWQRGFKEIAFPFPCLLGVIPGLFARFMKNIPGFELPLCTSQITRWILAISIVKLEIIRKMQSSFSQRKFNSSILNFSRIYWHALYTVFLKKYCLYLKLHQKMQKMLLNFYKDPSPVAG